MNAPPVSPTVPHVPVMMAEVLAALRPAAGETHVDGTFGAGGYSRALLDAADCRVIAIDRDPQARVTADAMKRQYGTRFEFLPGRFSAVETLLREKGAGKVDGFVLDLGVSSMQLDQPGRGFSFRADGPLDMRMDQDETAPSAATLVNGESEENLANIIYQYGEERHSRRIARRIVAEREKEPILTTRKLAEIVRAVLPQKPGEKIDPATRTFQALRIAVNAELDELQAALEAAVNILKPGGRLAVVSFHSLEDRLVKSFLIARGGHAPRGSRHLPFLPPAGDSQPAAFALPSRKAIFPSDEEASVNPRARSARMRVGIRTGEAAA